MPPASHEPQALRVLVTGGTGYLGRALLPALLERGHFVRALARPASLGRLPDCVEAMAGDPLRHEDLQRALADHDTVVHLVGVPKPSPAKARQFREVDLASIRALTQAIAATGNRPHVVYVSVAQPAPVMRAYLAVRREGEALVRALGVPATFVRPGYVLGPGHRWPYALLPIYAVLRWLPATRAFAERLGFVTLAQMTAALLDAIEHPPHGVRVVDVPAIRACRLDTPIRGAM